LGKLRDPVATDPLIRVLNDQDEFVRERAADALGRMGDSSAREALQRALHDADDNVRTTAEESLEKIKWHYSEEQSSS
jgi:HEAT repeat protein